MSPLSPLVEFLSNIIFIKEKDYNDKVKVNELIKNLNNIIRNPPKDLADRKVIYHDVILYKNRIKKMNSDALTAAFNKFMESYLSQSVLAPDPQLADSIQTHGSIHPKEQESESTHHLLIIMEPEESETMEQAFEPSTTSAQQESESSTQHVSISIENIDIEESEKFELAQEPSTTPAQKESEHSFYVAKSAAIIKPKPIRPAQKPSITSAVEEELKLSDSTKKFTKASHSVLEQSIIKSILPEIVELKNNNLYKFGFPSEQEKCKVIKMIYNNMAYLLIKLLEKSSEEVSEIDSIPVKKLISQLLHVCNNLDNYTDRSRSLLLERILKAPDDNFSTPFSLLFHPAYRPNMKKSDLEVSSDQEDSADREVDLIMKLKEKLGDILSRDKFLIRGPDQDKYFTYELEDGEYIEKEYANLDELLKVLYPEPESQSPPSPPDPGSSCTIL